jgi:Family of unknown function (DUF6011)
MSTTHTRQAYRPSHRPAAGSVDVSRPAGRCDCGLEVTVEELFSHECPNDIRNLRSALRAVEGTPGTGPADSLDVPEWRGGAGGHSPARRRGPSPAQIDLLQRLYVEAEEHDAEAAAEVATSLVDGKAASREIDRLIALRKARTAEPAAEAREQGCTPNRYPGDCRFCGSHVEARQGLLCRVDGRWAVEHKAGQCSPSQGNTAASPVTLADVPAGHYAIRSTGANDLVFYRVDRPTKGNYAGRTFVKMIVGGKPDQNVRRDHVAGILERIAADPDAGTRYGQELGQCCQCNRTLTDETSRRLGIGPECRKHI